MSEPSPGEQDAVDAARTALGWPAVDRVSRFPTGLCFYVFDLAYGNERAVVRLGRPGQRQTLIDGLSLWQLLAPLGVPLPTTLADGTDRPLPYVVMERLEGTDLGQVIGRLNEPQLQRIASAIAEAQALTMALPAAEGFGYAARPELARHPDWPTVVERHLNRSVGRIADHGLFDLRLADPLLDAFERLRPSLRHQKATPFLHDTTTKNVIVAPDGSLSGIVDVDDLCYGDPRYAIGLTRAALLSLGQPSLYADLWLAASGLVNDEVAALYTPIFLLDFMSEHGASFNGNQPASDPMERDRIEALYRDQLRHLQ